MFTSGRNKSHKTSFTTSRVTKQPSKKQRSFKDQNPSRSIRASQIDVDTSSNTTSPNLNSPTNISAIITLSVGPTQRLFAAHEDMLAQSPYFAQVCRQQFFSQPRRINLPDEEPEVFSAVLEYLYKGDYTPKISYDKKRDTWFLEDEDYPGRGSNSSTIFIHKFGEHILKDTAIYCAAEKYSLAPLKRLALKKQGLASGIQCSSILTSARYAYTHTPDSDSRLRAHYLALIIRSRNTFKRSGTMQIEMERGGKLFFDLFVALVNHLDDVANGQLR